MPPNPKRVAKQFLAQQDALWTDLYMAPYPRGLTRYLPNELDVCWWRGGEMHQGDIHSFIHPNDADYDDDAKYRVGENQRIRAGKVYLR